MAESRQRTVLEVAVDDREVRGLGSTMDRAFDPKTVEAFERSLDRTSRTLGKLIDQQTRLAQVLDRMEQRGRQQQASTRGAGGPQQGAGGRGGGGGAQGAGFAGRAAATAVGSYAGNVMAQAAQGSGAVATAMGAVPLVGPFLSGAVQGVNSFYQSHAQRLMARGGAFGATGLPGHGFGLIERLGAGMGVGHGQASGMASRFAQQTGMVGPDLLSAILGPSRSGLGGDQGLMGLSQIMGFRNIGGVLGAAGSAGGQGSFQTQEVLRDAVASGVMTGFREGRLDQFFGQFAGWLDQIRAGGIPLSVGSALQLVRGVGMMGGSFRGEAGMKAAQGFQQAITGAGRGQGPATLMMLRAAGLRGGGFGERGFMRARAHAGANPAEVMANFMQMFQRVTGGTSPEVAAQFAEQAFSELGMQMSAQQALDFATSAQSGAGQFGMGLTGGEAGAMAGDEVDAMAQRRRGAGFGARGTIAGAAEETTYQLRRANVGARVAGVATALRDVEIALAESLLPQLNQFRGFLNKTAQLIAAGDWTGLAMHAAESFGNVAEGAGAGAHGAVQETAEQIRREMQADPNLRLYLGVVGPIVDAITESDHGARTQQRGIGAGSEAQQQEMERMEAEGATTGERQQRLQEMQSGEGDPTSMIINGANMIIEGAEGLRRQGLPGETDLRNA